MKISFTQLFICTIILLCGATKSFAAVSPTASVTAAIGTPANGPQHYIQVTWSAATGATGYILESSPDDVNWSIVTILHGPLTYNADASDSGNVPVYYKVLPYATGDTAAATNCATFPIYTACNAPLLPVLSNAAATTMSLQVVADSNTTSSTYAIYCTTTSQYVQSNGSLGATEVFNTLAGWGTVTITGLATNTNYCFYALAQNNDGDIRGGQGVSLLATQQFNTSGSITIAGSTGSTAIWWSPGTTTSGNIFSYYSTGGCPGGYVGFSGSFNNYFGSFIRTPATNCTGYSSVILSFSVSNSYIASHVQGSPSLSDAMRFYMWIDNGYADASSVKINGVEVGQVDGNGDWLVFNTARSCVTVDVTFNLSSFTNLSNILFYLEADCPYNDSYSYSVDIDNISVGTPTTVACASTCNSSASTPVVSVNNACGSSTLSTTATGTLLWNTGATTSSITVTSAGTYGVTQNTGGCASPEGTGAAAPVTVNPNITVTKNCGNTVLSSNASGDGFLWSTGATTSSITVTLAATYSLTLTAGGGCTGTSNSAVTINSIPTVGETASPSSTVCAGSSVTLSGTGATTYSWTGGITNGVAFVPSGTNTYTVTGTANGCSNTATVTVTATPLPTVGETASPSSTGCAGSPVTLNGTGATSYTWTGGVTNGVAFALSGSNSYTVTGTTNGCSNTSTITLTATPLPTVGETASPSSTVCAGSPVTLSGTGATSYSWTGGVNNGVAFVPSGTNTYTVTGTANGCSNTSTVTVTATPLPTVGGTASPSSTVCAGSPVTLSGTGATSYTWTGGVNNGAAFVPSGTNTYTVTGTANGCSNTATVTVTATPLPTVNLAHTDNICPGDSAAIVVTGSGGNIYSWLPATNLTCSNCANPSAYPDTTTQYIVTAINAGCSVQDTITVIVTPLNASINPHNPTVCYGDSVTLNAGGGSTYLWTSSASITDPTSASITFVALTAATYTVTISEGSCHATLTGAVTVDPAPPVPHITQSQKGDTLFCSTNPDYSSYQWYYNGTLLVGQIDTFYVATQSGDYTVTVKNENGCSVSYGTNVIINGVYNFSLDNSIVLFPNPASNELTIRSSSIPGNEPMLISVMDVLGKTVQQEQMRWSDNTIVNIQELSSGIYFLQLQFTASTPVSFGQLDGKWIGRFVKE